MNVWNGTREVLNPLQSNGDELSFSMRFVPAIAKTVACRRTCWASPRQTPAFSSAFWEHVYVFQGVTASGVVKTSCLR
jgi:hypothetical protein